MCLAAFLSWWLLPTMGTVGWEAAGWLNRHYDVHGRAATTLDLVCVGAGVVLGLMLVLALLDAWEHFGNE
jgi:hypothetical protein